MNDTTGFIFDGEALREVMSTPSGRRFVFQMLDCSQIFQLAYAGEETHATAFNEGKKYLGVLLFAQLQEECPELYVRMMKESTQNSNEIVKHEE